jgi:hypothetical protein
VLEHADAEIENGDVNVPAGGGPVRPVRAHAALWSWLALGVVVALLGTLLLVKVVGGAGPTGTALAATSPQVFVEVTRVPASVANAVGTDSPTVPVRPPTVVAGAPLLTARARDGARLPVVLYVGTEFCSFCAAERWPLIIALSRFGTFNTLFNMQSSLVDYAPGTPTFSFYGTTYKSKHVVFRPFEVATDVLGPRGYGRLMKVPPGLRTELGRFDPTFSYPFVDVANRVVVLQANLSPETLAGLTRDEVAAGLADPTKPVTQAILVAANELTASICFVDGGQPASVCTSSGVLEADSVLRLAS